MPYRGAARFREPGLSAHLGHGENRATEHTGPRSDRPEARHREDDMGAYAAAYERSIADPTRFWGLAARDVRWLVPPDRVLDDGAPPFYRWFTGGELNTCDNALDR